MGRDPDITDTDTDAENSEQRDEGQAQDVADDARLRGTDLSEDSEKGGNADWTQLTPDDTPDLVDRMDEMIRSGRIDNDAYAGEPQMDDEDPALAAGGSCLRWTTSRFNQDRTVSRL
jgi:hypothetical protein